MNYTEAANQIVSLSGGKENIRSMTHCMTRLRFIIINKGKVDQDALKKVDGVIGTVFNSDELQIILGKNLMSVYGEVARQTGLNETAAIDADLDKPKEKKTVKTVAVDVINFISASVTPLVPGLIAGGMLKVFLLLATLIFASFKDTNTYTMLSMLADMPFYFMPIFVAYGASKKLGATPIYAMAVAAALIAPDFVAMVAKGDPITIVGLPIMLVKYKSTMLPALLIAICASYVEKGLNEIISGIFKSIFVGMGTIAVTYILGITILGPAGDFLGTFVVNIFVWSSANFGFIALALLAALLPWLIMTGMHHAISPFMAQFIANPGYDGVFRPAFILHNMAEGGACLGVALKTKDKSFRSECFSLAVGCIVAGVTEPAIYGVSLKLRKPMIGVMAGGAAGGIVAGLLGARAYAMGYSTVLALPIFMETAWAMAIGIAVAIIVAAVVTYILGFDTEAKA